MIQSVQDTVAMMPPSQNASRVQATGMTKEELEKTAHDFEGVFLAQMLKPMWEGVETDPVFGGGAGEDTMRQFLLQEYGKSMAEGSGYQLSPAIMDSMIRMQEQAGSLK